MKLFSTILFIVFTASIAKAACPDFSGRYGNEHGYGVNFEQTDCSKVKVTQSSNDGWSSAKEYQLDGLARPLQDGPSGTDYSTRINAETSTFSPYGYLISVAMISAGEGRDISWLCFKVTYEFSEDRNSMTYSRAHYFCKSGEPVGELSTYTLKKL